MEKSVQSLLGVSMDKIKEMVDVDTVIGTPIREDGITLIPVSKVTYGFAGGGSDLPSKTANAGMFGGGSGAGITVTPIAFLSIANGQASILPLVSKPDTVDSVISKVPDLVNKLSEMLAKKREENADKSEK